VHEFEFEEFHGELKSVFQHVSMFLENHVEGVAFQPYDGGNAVEARVDSGDTAPDESHFFVAVCAHRPQPGNPTFIYVPRAANVLRERERHIALLSSELVTKNQWLDEALQATAEFDREHQKLLEMFREQKEELERSNQWADGLNRELDDRRARVTELQEELARDQANARQVAEAYAAKVAALEQENRESTQWALDLNAEVQKQVADLGQAVAALHQTEKELEDRTAWALRLREDVGLLEHQVALFRMSRWVRLGRKIGLGPAP
jgi:hypothetical protein